MQQLFKQIAVEAAVGRQGLVKYELQYRCGLLGIAKSWRRGAESRQSIGQDSAGFEPHGRAGARRGTPFEKLIQIAEELDIGHAGGEVEIPQKLLDAWRAGGLGIWFRHSTNSCSAAV